MYTVIVMAECNLVGSDTEVEEQDFETLEEAQEFAASFTSDDLWQLAIETIDPSASVKIYDENGSEVE